MSAMFHRPIIAFFCFLLTFFGLRAQISVDYSLTPTQLVQNVLLGGGVSVSNVIFTGGTEMRGTFEGLSNLGIDTGLILATGDIAISIGPNDESSASDGGNVSGDSQLDALVGSTTYDAAVLEFDFVPSSDTIRFFYVFGSEEYPEYVCSDFNDVFAFFLSGPNPLGGNYVNENIAKIPGTTIPVAINSINPGVTGAYGTAGGCTSLAYSSLYTDNTSGTTIQYDGFTHVLEASANVVACSNYHIKIAIADVTDGAYDSGVFLKAKSFSSPAVNISAVGSSFDSTMVEGCGYATYIFTRGGNLSSPYTINYLIEGDAINGIDYADLSGNPIPNSITFNPGEDSAFLYIDPVNDAISELTEQIKLSVPQVISCVDDTLSATIYIINVDPMTIELTGDTLICVEEGEFTTLNVDFTGGYGPFDFAWDNGLGNSNQVIVAPEHPTTYTVSILDSCGNESAVKSITIHNECEIRLTNVVTPNSDGFNDFVHFANLEMYPNSELLIFNRWGKIVYKNDSYNNDWSPSDISEGTYYYILKKSDGIKHPAKEFHGTITILK
ncbi:MAG: choice-of-anchor L domain-containing protein [Bacteroidales bacterium]|jgi:gliding motility-associated-like protein|nr:choice-of-anchor L domain-containing protein [Bacteroidales bacterium]